MKNIFNIIFKVVCLILITLCFIFSIKTYNKIDNIIRNDLYFKTELQKQIAYIEWKLDVCCDNSKLLLYIEGVDTENILNIENDNKKEYFINGYDNETTLVTKGLKHLN